MPKENLSGFNSYKFMEKLVDSGIVEFEPDLKKDLQTRKTLGEEIRQKRKELNLSIGEFAKATGWDKAHISRIENGKVGMSSDAVCSIADKLSISRFDLLIKGRWMVADRTRITDLDFNILKNLFDSGMWEFHSRAGGKRFRGYIKKS